AGAHAQEAGGGREPDGDAADDAARRGAGSAGAGGDGDARHPRAGDSRAQAPHSEELMNTRNRLLELLKSLAYEEREVILASGKPSNFYIDCKQAVLTAEGHFLVGTLINELLENIAPEVRAVGG